MSDPLDRLEQTAERIVGRAEYEQQNRWGLLWVHAVIGMLAGFQMLLWGSAGTIENVVGVWSRPVMAFLGLLGGMLLSYGLSQRPRSISYEVAGLVVIGAWDLLMTLGLMTARIQQSNFGVIPLGERLEPGYVVAYPSTVYGGLFALICVHLWTLRKIKQHRTNGHAK